MISPPPILLLLLPYIYAAPYVISPFNGANLRANTPAGPAGPAVQDQASGAVHAMNLYSPTTTDYSGGDDFGDLAHISLPTSTDYSGGDDFPNQVAISLPTSTNYANGDDFVDQVGIVLPTSTNYANGDDFTDQVGIVLPTSTDFSNGDDFVNQVHVALPTSTDFSSGDDFVNQVNVALPTSTSFAGGDDFVNQVNVASPTTTSFASGNDFAANVAPANVASPTTTTSVASGNDFVANAIPANAAPVTIAPTGLTAQSWMPDDSQPYQPGFFPNYPSDLDPFAADPFGDSLYHTDANGEFTIIDVYVDPTIQTAIPNYYPDEQFEWYNDTPETRPTPTIDQPDPYGDNDSNDYDPNEDTGGSVEAQLYAKGVVPLHVQQLRAHVQTADSRDSVMRVVNAAGDVILVHFQKTDQPGWTLKDGVLVHQ